MKLFSEIFIIVASIPILRPLILSRTVDKVSVPSKDIFWLAIVVFAEKLWFPELSTTHVPRFMTRFDASIAEVALLYPPNETVWAEARLLTVIL